MHVSLEPGKFHVKNKMINYSILLIPVYPYHPNPPPFSHPPSPFFMCPPFLSSKSLKQCVPQGPLAADPGSLPLPPQTGLSPRGKGRTPSAPEVGKDGGLELVKERPEDLLSLRETPESLSDSLYDSLSSCGSQG